MTVWAFVLDGVVWLAGRAIPGAPENLLDLIKTNAAELRKTGCPVC